EQQDRRDEEFLPASVERIRDARRKQRDEDRTCDAGQDAETHGTVTARDPARRRKNHTDNQASFENFAENDDECGKHWPSLHYDVTLGGVFVIFAVEDVRTGGERLHTDHSIAVSSDDFLDAEILALEFFSRSIEVLDRQLDVLCSRKLQRRGLEFVILDRDFNDHFVGGCSAADQTVRANDRKDRGEERGDSGTEKGNRTAVR